jgi:hypothetical protein
LVVVGRGALGVAKAGSRSASAGAWLIGAFAALVWLAAAGPSLADDAGLEAQKVALFQQMLRQPTNLDVAYAYADVAARLGDNESAVSTLEHLLLFNPNLPRLDLELGILYYRMGSFDAARSYLQKAAELHPPPDVQAQVDHYLARIADLDAVQRLTGYVLFASQYQSDATVSSSSPLVQSPVSNVLLGTQFTKQPGVNLLGSGGFLYSYDLGTQNRDAFEVGGVGFADHYFRNSQIDLDFGELQAGPRLRFPDLGLPFVEWASLKPYAIVNEVGLGEQQYFYTLGAGLEATAVLWGDLSMRIANEFRDKSFSSAADRPASIGLTGYDDLLIFALKKPITENSAIIGEFDYLDENDRFAYFGNRTYAVSAAYQIGYPDPTGTFKLPLRTELFGSRTWSLYGAQDPCCNTNPNPGSFSGSDRFDRHWRFGVTQNFPIAPNLSIVLQVERDVISSNLPVYGYTSDTVLLGPQIRF